MVIYKSDVGSARYTTHIMTNFQFGEIEFCEKGREMFNLPIFTVRMLGFDECLK